MTKSGYYTSLVLGGIGLGNLELVVDLCLKKCLSLLKHLQGIPEFDDRVLWGDLLFVSKEQVHCVLMCSVLCEKERKGGRERMGGCKEDGCVCVYVCVSERE